MSQAIRADESAGMAYLRLLFLTMIATLALILTGCESAEDRQIAQAHACLDEARDRAKADECVNIVQGLESEEAYLIRCSANFIAQGFIGTRVADAFQEINDNPASGKDPMATAMAYLVFDNTLTLHSISATMTNCTRSGVNAMLRLSVMAQLATFIANPSGGLLSNILNPSDPNFDANAITAQITDLVNNPDPAKQAEVGLIAQTAQQAYCNEGSSFKENEICKNLDSAIATGGGDAAAIGASLLSSLTQLSN